MSELPVLGRDLRLRQKACYHGPNPWSMAPVLVCELAVDPGYSSRFVEGARRLARLFPEWTGDAPSPGVPPDEALGNFLARWARGALNEVRGYLQDAGARKDEDGLTWWVAFHDPRVTGLAMQMACRALGMASSREDFSAELHDELEKLWQLCRGHHPDYQARILMTAARQRDVPVMPFITGTKYWQYGWGSRSRVFMESLSNADGNLAGGLAKSKPLSKAVFASLGMPTPKHVIVTDAAQLESAALAVRYPCVIKPLDMGGGKGVTAGIETPSELSAAYDNARQVTRGSLMVEQMVPGEDHRLMLIGGQLVAAIRREASTVVGDGNSTIGQLIKHLNAERSSNIVKSRYRRPVALDDALANHLAKQGMGMDSVPAAGARIRLRSNSNVSTGGVAFDVTDKVHPAVVAMAEQLAVTVGLGTAGLDYLTTDITRSPLEGHGAFIEMNTTPAMDVLVAAGWTDEKIGALVLGDFPGRIPVEMHVVPSLDAPAARHPPAEPGDGSTAASVCGKEVKVGPLELHITDTTPWAAVRSALRNKAVTSLRIVCTPDDILANGLPLDRLDRVCLDGVSLPEPWHRVVERCAASVESTGHLSNP